MRGLQLILYLAITAYSIYSLIAYLVRRSDNKGALRALQTSGAVLRALTPEERQAVQAFLVDPLRPRRVTPLLDDRVRQLSGEYAQHGLSGTHGVQVVHHTLGGVDVVLPYDAAEYLQPSNRAEVALTARTAVVISLNGRFDILGGRARAQEQRPGEHRPAVSRAADEGGSPAPRPERGPEPEARIVGQREETEAEAAARSGPGRGGLPALLLAGSFVLLMLGGRGEAVWPWLALALALLAAALWLLWGPRRAPRRRKVSRAQGTLTRVTLQNPGSAGVPSERLFLADWYPLVFPSGWLARLELPADRRVDLDLRDDDHSVVRLGDALSVDQEVRRFPLVYWGRHLTIAVVGAAMVFHAVLIYRPFRADVAQASAALRKAETRTLADAAEARARPPAPGDLARLRGEVRCQITPAQDGRPGPISCLSVRWGGEALRVEPVALEPALQSFASGELLRSQREPLLTLALVMQMAGDGGGFDGGAPSVHTIEGLGALVREVQRICDQGAPEAACAHFRETMESKVMVGDEGDTLPWAKLVERAAASEKRKPGKKASRDAAAADTGIAEAGTVERLRADLRAMAEPLVLRLHAGPLEAALRSQRGGVLLPLDLDEATRLRTALARGPEKAEAAGSDPSDESQPIDTGDWVSQWSAYRALAGGKGALPLELQGLVTDVRIDEHGDPVLTIDASRTRDNAAPAMLRLAALLLGLGLVVVHAPLTALNLVRARARAYRLAQGRAPRSTPF